MARVAPDDEYADLADADLLVRSPPDLDLLDPTMPGVDILETRAQAAEAAALAVSGVSKSAGASAAAGIGGLVLVTSHGFSGAYLGSSHSVGMTAIAGDGTGMERDYDFTAAAHAADLESPEAIGRTAGETPRSQRLNPRKVETHRVPVVFHPRAAGSLVGIWRARSMAHRSPARPASCRTPRRTIVPAGIRIVDDRCAAAACARGRSMRKVCAGKPWRWLMTASCKADSR